MILYKLGTVTGIVLKIEYRHAAAKFAELIFLGAGGGGGGRFLRISNLSLKM